ncbi:C-C motif chemokine 4 homolog [Stegastes partitus]|uniref:C-C motif chemokine 4 homolog n=1 Tax=Stegastes partitus TaxID=144197 RepID=A0A3B5BDE0_9TELE|nr:PREDICTED: C-C motif chemokine 4 homolog [Stegastes partitus]
MVSIKVTVMAITLVTLCLLDTNHAVNHKCCPRYMTVKIPFSAIKGYSVQTVRECPFDAIILHTKKGKACVKPGWDWPVQYVAHIRTRAQKVHETSQHLTRPHKGR